MSVSEFWLALVIGNTRLHWGYFYQKSFIGAWHTPHLTRGEISILIERRFQNAISDSCTNDSKRIVNPLNWWAASLVDSPIAPADVWIASAVIPQTRLWADSVGRLQSEQLQWVERSQLPLANLYPTLGIDRAITLLGAGKVFGWPVLVIDGGTALTFTAGTNFEYEKGQLYGGAILPGVRLQKEALRKGATALDAFVGEMADQTETSEGGLTIARRWAVDSVGAIASGLSYGLSATLLDYIDDWWTTFPNASVVITGGDAQQLYALLKQRTPEIASRVNVSSDLMFYGMQAYREAVLA